jgi:hypothetical protein
MMFFALLRKRPKTVMKCCEPRPAAYVANAPPQRADVRLMEE